VDLRRLEVFSRVAARGSLAAAAAELSFTPSAVSQQMARLEAELGAQLLVRSRRGITLTPAGALLAERAEALLGQLAEARRDVADLAEGRSGRLAVGAVPTCASTLAAPAIAAFRASHPGVQVHMATHDVDELERGLRRRAVDLAVIARDPALEPAGDTVAAVVGEDPFVLALPASHRLAGRPRIEPADLDGERFVGTPRWPGLASLAPALASEGVAVGFDGLLSNDFHLAQKLVALDQGLALIPGLAVSPGLGALAFRRLTRLAPRRVVEAHRPLGAPPRPLADAFVAALAKEAAAWSAEISARLDAAGG
jgi:DNA-binding transcriptional LysR family regulator